MKPDNNIHSNEASPPQGAGVSNSQNQLGIKKLNAGNSFYTLADLGGIQFKLMAPGLSIANDRFAENPYREVSGDGEVIRID